MGRSCTFKKIDKNIPSIENLCFLKTIKKSLDEGKISIDVVDNAVRLILNAKLASVTGEPGTEIIDPTKPPMECVKYRSHCNNFGGAPNCYTGFCEQVAECIDCPGALVDKNKNGDFVMEVCGNSGICRLGWKSPNSKGGNGYCECKNGMKGLGCNEY